MPEAGREYTGEGLEAMLRQLMKFQKLLQVVERRGPSRDVLTLLVARGVCERAFFVDRAAVEALREELSSPVRTV